MAREWTDGPVRGTVETMSRDSGSEQPGQRTVADLLAQYGGAPKSGPRRRRRRAEENSDAAPQQIIDRVLSESGRMRAVPAEPGAESPSPAAPAHAETAAPSATSTSAGAPAGYFDQPTGYVEMPVAHEAAAPAPPAPSSEGDRLPPHVDNADAPTGFLDRVPAYDEQPPDNLTGYQEHRTGYQERPAVSREQQYPTEQPYPPHDPGAGYQEQPSAYQEQRPGYREAPASQPDHRTEYPDSSGYWDRTTPERPAADLSAFGEQQPATGPGKSRPGGLGAAAASAFAGRAAARASWPIGGLAEPVREPGEPMTEQIPRISSALDATVVSPPNAQLGAAATGLGGLPPEADEAAQWYDFGEDGSGQSAATSLLNPVSAPNPSTAHPADDGYSDDTHDHADESEAAVASAGPPAGWTADEAAGLDDASADAGSPLRQWLVMAGQLVAGVLGGAALWLGFQFLWRQIPVLALVLAAVVTVGLVLVVRKIRQADDVQTTVLAVLVGLVVTVTPAAFLLVAK